MGLSGFTVISRRELARSTTNKRVLEKLAHDEDVTVRVAVGINSKTSKSTVAENANTPRIALNSLSYDRDPYVKQAVATNPNTPRRALLRLCQDDSSTVRKLAASNPNILKKWIMSKVYIW